MRLKSSNDSAQRFAAKILLVGGSYLLVGTVWCAWSPERELRVVLFGDSNTDIGFAGAVPVEASYISDDASRLRLHGRNGPHQLAGKLEAMSGRDGVTFRVVNHAATGTATGLARTPSGSPGARSEWQGVTRFEAEVLGLATEGWNGGNGRPIRQAFRPTSRDYVYVSMGTNDAALSGDSASTTIANLAWMATRWTEAGLPSTHFIITTLAPRADSAGAQIPLINAGVRKLAAEAGLTLIDLAQHVSADDGRSWRSPALHIGDGIHYAESVRAWLAERIAASIEQQSRRVAP